MKIYVKAAKFQSKWEHRLDYTNVDAVINELEKKLESIQIKEGILLDLSYSHDQDRYILNCNICDGASWVTPGGLEVRYSMPRYSANIDILSPTSFDSEYGQQSLTHLDSWHLNLPHWLLRIYMPEDSNILYTYEAGEERIITLDDVPQLIIKNLERIDSIIDKAYVDQKAQILAGIKRAEEEKKRRAEAMKSKAYNQPVSLSNIKKLFTEYRKSADSKLSVKGNYARLTSYEDDFVQYFDINKMIEEINADKDGLVFGDFAEDPGLIFDYGLIASDGIHHAFEEDRYEEFKKNMNQKYGFTR